MGPYYVTALVHLLGRVDILRATKAFFRNASSPLSPIMVKDPVDVDTYLAGQVFFRRSPQFYHFNVLPPFRQAFQIFGIRHAGAINTFGGVFIVFARSEMRIMGDPALQNGHE